MIARSIFVVRQTCKSVELQIVWHSTDNMSKGPFSSPVCWKKIYQCRLNHTLRCRFVRFSKRPPWFANETKHFLHRILTCYKCLSFDMLAPNSFVTSQEVDGIFVSCNFCQSTHVSWFYFSEELHMHWTSVLTLIKKHVSYVKQVWSGAGLIQLLLNGLPANRGETTVNTLKVMSRWCLWMCELLPSSPSLGFRQLRRKGSQAPEVGPSLLS